MSSGALFGNSAVRSTNKNLVEFKAGKMTMKGKMVYPDNRKGLLYVYQSDDSLMHFCWKDRTTGVVEDDLIIFPDDCEFKVVSQCKTGRVYQLKFKSSNRKFFFWLQDLKTDKDEEHCRKINEVLNNPPVPGSQRNSGVNPEGDLQNLLNNMSQQQLMQLFGGVGQIGGLGSLLGSMNRPFAGNRNSTSSSISTTTTKQTSASPTPTITGTPELAKSADKLSPKPVEPCESSASNDNKILLSDLQNFLSGIPTSLDQRNIVSELSAAIPAAISTTEDLESTINRHLPSGDSLSTTLSSPQFSQALSMFWSALQSGQAGPVFQQFGVSPEVINAAAIGNIEQFISAFENETKTSTDIAEKKNTSDRIDSEKMASENPFNNHDKKDDNDDEGMALD